MKIFVVRIGNKYGPEYEDYLESKLGDDYELVWIREAYDPSVKLQWNKMSVMNLADEEPVCVMDIDLLLINDFKKVFDYPVERGQFLAMRAWWRDTLHPDYSINGGFYKYYPKDCNYIYEKFMSDPQHFQSLYIRAGITSGPVNGEQYFVEDAVKEQLELITLPNAWQTRWLSDDNMSPIVYTQWQKHFNAKYAHATGLEYAWFGDFNEEIKLVHFTHEDNLPHTWKYFDQYTRVK
jgi:hypothetical protein